MARPCEGVMRWVATVLLAAMLPACGGSPQPPDAVERIKLEQELQRVSDQYGQTLTQSRRYEELNLDARLKAAMKHADKLQADLGAATSNLATIDRQQRAMLDQMELPISATQPATQRDWSEQLAALRLLKSEAELSRVAVRRSLVRSEEELSDLRQLLAQRDILARQALSQEKRLLELNRKLR
ncbi:MAG: hypothetical protein PHU85_15980 [Phycisphaerae bacterium]|nr:hypothetical protein [Phycisphaerae bacterium]